MDRLLFFLLGLAVGVGAMLLLPYLGARVRGYKGRH